MKKLWAGHHQGSHTPTSIGTILLSKMACQPKHFGRQCMTLFKQWFVIKIKQSKTTNLKTTHIEEFTLWILIKHMNVQLRITLLFWLCGNDSTVK